MDIYKLSDDILVEPVRRGKRKGVGTHGVADSFGAEGGALKITDIKQGVKNENRVNVYVNGKYSFSLDVAQVVDLGVKVGLEITEERLAELKKASEFGKAYQRALEWMLVRPRSAQELKDYLRKYEMRSEAKERKKDWDREREVAELIARGEDLDAERLSKRVERAKAKKIKQEKYDFKDLIIEKLVGKGYVDDRKFAEYYVENRFVKKGISEKRLRMELMKKGISKEIIEEVMAESVRSDEEEIKKIIAKKRAKYDDEKLIMYLVRQGFSFELAKSLVLEFGRD